MTWSAIVADPNFRRGLLAGRWYPRSQHPEL